MPQDHAQIEPGPTAEPPPIPPPRRDRPVAVAPAAFAVSGGTYQLLVPSGGAWRRDDH